MIGRGGRGDPDFQQRLETINGEVPAAKGLYSPNYWTPGKPGAPVRTRGIPVHTIEYLIRRLDLLLRDTVGLNVRQPSSNVAPFRAQQWQFDTTVSLAASASSTVTVSFRTGQAAVPEGVRGVMASLEFFFIDTDQDVLVTPTDLQASLAKNGSVVPGFEAMNPGGITLETISDAAGSNARGSDFPGQRCFVPLKLDPDDFLTLTITNADAANTLAARFLLSGWFYPIEVEADGILGTVADRGAVGRSGPGVGR